MFIEITTPQNPLRLENALRPYKRGEKPFTPEVARQILQSTNHKKNIYDTLQLIAALPKEQQAAYKDIVLATFDHREQPTDTILLGKKLAASHGFEDELKKLVITAKNYDYAKDCIFYHSGINKKSYICVQSEADISKYPDNCSIICTHKNISLTCTNPTAKELKFTPESSVYMLMCILPQNVDFSMCDKVEEFVADYNNVQTITFKNKGQKDKWTDSKNKGSLNIPRDWQGTIIYTDEQPPQNGLNKIITRGITR